MTVYDKILDLLSRSPELYGYLTSHREKLGVHDYADIVECAYPGKDGSICLGNLLHGFFFDRSIFDRCASALYCTGIYTGELPGEYGFMKELSAKLRDDPEYGKTLFETL